MNTDCLDHKIKTNKQTSQQTNKQAHIAPNRRKKANKKEQKQNKKQQQQQQKHCKNSMHKAKDIYPIEDVIKVDLNKES